MQHESASQLADAWVRSHGPQMQMVQPLYAPLHAELMSLLPDDGVFGVAEVDGKRSVLAVTGRSLLIVWGEEVPTDQESFARVHATRLALDPSRATVELQTWTAWGMRSVRHRIWGFTLAPDQRTVVLQTREVLRGDFDTGPQSDELVARAVAAALDWRVPEEDLGRNAY